MEDRSGADGKFITQLMNKISSELQANNNCSKSTLFIVTEHRSTSSDTFETAIDIDGSRFQINSSVELQDKSNSNKDVWNEFSINRLTIFSLFQFISIIVRSSRSDSLYLERN